MSDLELKMLELLDWIYNTHTEGDALHLEIGIWDWDNDPHTFYAVVKDRKGNTIFGETSYDSITVTQAIDCTLKELSE